MGTELYNSEEARSDQAIEWLARLRADDVTPEEIADFATWLDASSLNKVAFDEATELWHSLSDMPLQQAVSTPKAKRKVYNALLPLSAAASVLFACFAMVLQLTTPQFTTGKGEQRRVILADGSTAHLNTDSSLSVHFSDDQRLIKLDQGEVWFDIAKNPDRPFLVEGQFASAEAVGTAFSVREMPGYTQVQVTQGVVAFEAHNPPTLQTATSNRLIGAKMLLVGQQGTASANMTDVVEFDEDKALAWQRGQLIYDNVRLDDLVEDLNRYLPTTMSVSGSQLESRRVSAVLYLDDQNAMLEALSATLPIRWKPVSDSLIIISPKPQ